MFVYYGNSMFGKCDVVPELFYVGTFFFHVNFVPLIPLGSHLVLGKSGDSYQTVKIPFSIKSLLYAWIRAATFLGGVIAWIAFLIEYNEPRHESLVPIVALAMGLTFLYLLAMLYPRRIKPSYQRACQLGNLAGLTDRGWAALNVLYGRDPLARPGAEATDTLRV